MQQFLLESGEVASFYVSLVTILVLLLWESAAPRRRSGRPIRPRWMRNFSLYLSGVLSTKLIVPLVSFEVSRQALAQQWGLMPGMGVPLWLNIVLGLLILDATRYGIHWAFHRYQFLWRIHRVHHTDQEFDFTTALRSHPAEVVLLAIVFVGVITVCGIHPVTLILAEMASVVVTNVNHGNVRISSGLDRILRLVVVTPDMHRVHHSSLPREFTANLGGVFPWWDWLFGTYIAQPKGGHQGMKVGLPGYASDDGGKFISLLLDPFVSPNAEFLSSSARPDASTELPLSRG